MTPPFLLPAEEAARLAALHEYEQERLLREPIFDELVRLTARVFDLPISLISLVKADEVEYVANIGLPGLEKQPRVEAICAVAIRENKAVVFADITSEPQRLTAEALLAAQQRNLQFYAGTPVRLPTQQSIGTLCVIDHQVRTFSAEEQEALADIAATVAQILIMRHYCLVDGLGEEHWQVLQAQLVEEIGALAALVRYITARVGRQIPVSTEVLTCVQRRLTGLNMLLVEYYNSKQ